MRLRELPPFEPEIEWDQLDQGAVVILWLPRRDLKVYRTVGIIMRRAGRIGGHKGGENIEGVYSVRLVKHASKKHHKLGYLPLLTRPPGASKSVNVYENDACIGRLVATAAIQEAYKIATVRAYRDQYLKDTYPPR